MCSTSNSTVFIKKNFVPYTFIYCDLHKLWIDMMAGLISESDFPLIAKELLLLEANNV